MRVLITGAGGQLGRALQQRGKDFSHQLLLLNRHQLDIAFVDQIREAFSFHRPDLIINCAAYTNVDRAEEEVVLAHRINHQGPANLAGICREQQVPLIHISTDYVFSGDSHSPYEVDDPCHPQTQYGGSKLKGEEAIQAAYDQHLIIRTSWLFSEFGNNFVKTMLRLAEERARLSVVSDQIGGPSYAGHLATLIWRLVDEIEQGEFNDWGTYQFSGKPCVSWFEFAEVIFREASKAGLLSTLPEVSPVSSEAFPTVATRPAYSVMSNDRLVRLLDYPVEQDWRKGLKEMLRSLGESRQ